MKTVEFFQEMIDELLSDRQYYEGELKDLKADPKNPAWAMMQKRSYQKLIKECNDKIQHFRNGIVAVKNLELAA